jgi:hypothetical protein
VRQPLIFSARQIILYAILLVIQNIISTFASGIEVERFVLLATTGKNAKTSFRPTGFSNSPHYQFVMFN